MSICSHGFQLDRVHMQVNVTIVQYFVRSFSYSNINSGLWSSAPFQKSYLYTGKFPSHIHNNLSHDVMSPRTKFPRQHKTSPDQNHARQCTDSQALFLEAGLDCGIVIQLEQAHSTSFGCLALKVHAILWFGRNSITRRSSTFSMFDTCREHLQNRA